MVGGHLSSEGLSRRPGRQPHNWAVRVRLNKTIKKILNVWVQSLQFWGSETLFLGSKRLKNNRFDPHLRSPWRRASGVPVVSRFTYFCGNAKNTQELLEEIKQINLGGGNGSIIGRNTFQRPNWTFFHQWKNVVLNGRSGAALFDMLLDPRKIFGCL